jgi:hypothetical protein
MGRMQLKDFITTGGRNLHFVFVSACHSSYIGQAFVDAGVKHVVCCRHDSELRESAAIEFEKIFYRNLACGKRNLQQAFDIAKQGILHSPRIPGDCIAEEAEKFCLLPEGTQHATAEKLALCIEAILQRNPKVKILVIHQLGVSVNPDRLSCREQDIFVDRLSLDDTIKLFGFLLPNHCFARRALSLSTQQLAIEDQIVMDMLVDQSALEQIVRERIIKDAVAAEEVTVIHGKNGQSHPALKSHFAALVRYPFWSRFCDLLKKRWNLCCSSASTQVVEQGCRSDPHSTTNASRTRGLESVSDSQNTTSPSHASNNKSRNSANDRESTHRSGNPEEQASTRGSPSKKKKKKTKNKKRSKNVVHSKSGPKSKKKKKTLSGSATKDDESALQLESGETSGNLQAFSASTAPPCSFQILLEYYEVQPPFDSHSAKDKYRTLQTEIENYLGIAKLSAFNSLLVKKRHHELGWTEEDQRQLDHFERQILSPRNKEATS